MSLTGEPIPLVCEYWFAKLRLHDIRSRIIKMEDLGAAGKSRRQDRLYCASCDAEKLLYNYIYNLEVYARLIGEDLSFPFDEVDRASIGGADNG